MNRYEPLFGYNYRRLVDSLSEQFSVENDITVASVLLFKSFNENLYYISSSINPLLMPEQITEDNLQDVVNKKHYSPLCLWYLASFFCSNKGITMINNVFFKENKQLVEANASTFNLTFIDFDKLKNEWIYWLNANKNNDWSGPPIGEDLNNNPIINQCFILANFLLILMPITINHSEMGKENNASSIYKAVMGKRGNFIHNPWITENGKFRFIKEVHKWKFIQNKEHSFGPLLDIIEFVLLHPLPFEHKEYVMRSFTVKRRINRTEYFNPKPYNFSVMAYPLLYNAEFQGIVYITKYGDVPFTNDDRNRFIAIIKGNKFESRLADSKYDLALIAMKGENISFEKPPLLRILSNLHHFSSACSGIAVFKDEKEIYRAEEVYRISKGTGIQMENVSRDDDADFIKTLIEEKVFCQNNHPVWLFKANPLRKQLLSLPSNGEKYTAKSVVVLSVEIDEKALGFLILFYEEIESIINESCFYKPEFGLYSNSRDVFAERLHSTIVRLIDADNEHRQVLEAQKEINRQKAKELELMTPHRMVNLFEPRAILPLRKVAELITDEKLKTSVSTIADYLSRFKENARKFSKAWRDYLDYKKGNDIAKIQITSSNLNEIIDKFQSRGNDFLGAFEHNANEFQQTILTSPEIFEYLIDLLITNTQEVYEEEELDLENRKLKINFKNYKNFSKLKEEYPEAPQTFIDTNEEIVIVSVWNSETQFTTKQLKYAGYDPFSDNPDRTGFGFYFLQSSLFHLDAIKLEKEKFFLLKTTNFPKSSEVILGFRCVGENYE